MIERDDWLDARLREDARRTHPDEGFTERVMGRLARRRAPAWWKPVLILGSTALGSLLAVLLSPVGPMALEGLAEVTRFRGFTPELATAMAMMVVLGVCGFVLLED
jgi:hypothetical protein